MKNLLACFAALLLSSSASAGQVKGYVYNPDGTLYKSSTFPVTVRVFDAATGTKLVEGIADTSAYFLVTFDSLKVTTTGDKARTVTVTFEKKIRTTEVNPTSSGGTGTQVGGLLGVPAVTHTLHVVVTGD
jgi:WD40 repeat protein